MTKYVSEDIICAKMMHCGFRSPNMTVSDFINDELPSADVQPVKRGCWIEQYDDAFLFESTVLAKIKAFECSECGEQVNVHMPSINYCPNCGARMKKE